MMTIGIDPGINGGIACQHGSHIKLVAMPKTLSDRADFLISTIAMASNDPLLVMIERVHSFPGQGVASSFTFGRGLGQLEGIIATTGVEPEYVVPRVWQKHFGFENLEKVKKYEWKKLLLAGAKNLCPNVNNINLKTCDAMLIMKYALSKQKGTQS